MREPPQPVFAAFIVPVTCAFSLLLAVLVNRIRVAQAFFRSTFFPAHRLLLRHRRDDLAARVLQRSPVRLANTLLRAFGLDPVNWLSGGNYWRTRGAAVRSSTAATVLRYVLASVLAVLFLPPFYVLLRNAFSTQSWISAAQWHWTPNAVDLANLRDLFTNPDVPILRSLLNSAAVAVTTTVLTIAISAMAGHGLARIDNRASRVVLGLCRRCSARSPPSCSASYSSVFLTSSRRRPFSTAPAIGGRSGAS